MVGYEKDLSKVFNMKGKEAEALSKCEAMEHSNICLPDVQHAIYSLDPKKIYLL